MSGRVVALVSGGVESLCLVEWFLHPAPRKPHPSRRGGSWGGVQRRCLVMPVYVRCGLRWESAEMWWLRRWLRVLRHPRLKPLVVLDLPVRSMYGRHWSLTQGRVPSRSSPDAAVYLPGRNVLLLGCAAICAARRGIGRLALGTLAGNPFGDATPQFFRTLSRCMRLALGRSIQVLAPFRQMSKAQVIASMPSEPLHLTFSCLAPRGRQHCGRCNKCAERRRAFRAARLPDPTHYAS